MVARVRLSLPLLRAYLRRCKATDPRTKVALVLGAAGAPSAYSAGVIDELLAAEVPIDLVVGASGGALNGCLYLLGRLADQPCLASETWARVTLDQVMAPAWLLRVWNRVAVLPEWVQRRLRIAILLCYPLALTLAYAYKRNAAGLFSNTPLRQLVCRELARTLGLPPATGAAACGHALVARWRAKPDAPALLIAATDASRGRDVLFALAESPVIDRLRAAGWAVETVGTWPASSRERPDLAVPALLASAALPPAFPPQLVDGRLYLDGGFTQPLPIGAALDAGATHVLVVEPAVSDDCGRPTHLLEWLRRATAAVVQAGRDRELRALGGRHPRPRLYRLAPGRKLAGALDFDGASRLAAAGHRDARSGFWWPG